MSTKLAYTFGGSTSRSTYRPFTFTTIWSTTAYPGGPVIRPWNKFGRAKSNLGCNVSSIPREVCKFGAVGDGRPGLKKGGDEEEQEKSRSEECKSEELDFEERESGEFDFAELESEEFDFGEFDAEKLDAEELDAKQLKFELGKFPMSLGCPTHL